MDTSSSVQVGPSLTDTVVLPMLCGLIGLIVFAIAMQNYKESGKLPRSRWAGYGLAALGALFSLSSLWAAINPSTGFLYRASIYSKKVLYSHYLVFPISLALLIGFFVWQRLLENSMKVEPY